MGDGEGEGEGGFEGCEEGGHIDGCVFLVLVALVLVFGWRVVGGFCIGKMVWCLDVTMMVQ